MDGQDRPKAETPLFSAVPPSYDAHMYRISVELECKADPFFSLQIDAVYPDSPYRLFSPSGNLCRCGGDVWADSEEEALALAKLREPGRRVRVYEPYPDLRYGTWRRTRAECESR